MKITGSRDGAIVRAVVNIGRELGIEVLAEGVETADQVRQLREDGCSLVQGYYFSRPISAEDFEALCQRGISKLHQDLPIPIAV